MILFISGMLAAFGIVLGVIFLVCGAEGLIWIPWFLFQVFKDWLSGK